MIAVVSGRRRYAQWIVQSSSRIVPTRQTNHATSHGRTAHGANSGSIHGRVDVRQERAGRVVRVAAVEPDPDAGPVRAGVGAAGLAPGDQPGQDEREGQAQQQDRGDPARIVEARDLATERPAEDAGPPPGRRGRRRRTGRRRSARGHAPCPGRAADRAAAQDRSWQGILARRSAAFRRTRVTGRERCCLRPLSSRGSTPQGVAIACGRWNRHHHRRRGRQGPRPRHPEPLRRARGRPGRDDRGHQHRVVARPGSRRALPRRLRGARRQARPTAPRGDPAAGQRRDRGRWPSATRPASS